MATVPPHHVHDQLNLAIEHHRNAELSVAEGLYREVLKAAPDNPVALHFLGLAAHQAGRSDEAVTLIQRAVEIKSDYDGAYGNLGNALVALGRHDEAIISYRRAMEINPNSPELHNALGLALKAQGNLEEAIASYDLALSAKPEFAAAHNNKGNALLKCEMLDDAIDSLKQALAINPDLVNAHYNLGLAYIEIGHFEKASARFKRVLEINPKYADAHFNLGNAEFELKHVEEAIECYRNALALNPNDGKSYNNLGLIFVKQTVLELAIPEFEKAIDVQPYLVDPYLNLGDLYKEKKLSQAAIKAYQRFLKQNFDDEGDYKKDTASIYNRIGLVLSDMAQMNEALEHFNKAVEIDPELAECHSNLATCLLNCGMLVKSMQHCDIATKLAPTMTRMHSNKLFSAHYFLGQNAKSLYRLHKEWEKCHGQARRANWPRHLNNRNPDRQLRIGFVSPDLGHHPVGYLVLGLLEHLSMHEIATVCYSSRFPDVMTERFIDAAAIWHDVYQQSDNTVANMILADEIDILIDLSGHTGGNRLTVFSRKPAPIQVSWAGYVGTTGLSAMDYVLSDIYSTPLDEEKYYTEKVIRMPDGWICYSPPKNAPEVGPLPLTLNGWVTFGSFSNPAKINEEVVSAWANIMNGVAGSRLLLKYKGVDADANATRLFDSFAAGGVDKSRITLEGWSEHSKLLARYNDVDIALDTFPYSGGVTAFEALWMGVPVITVSGDTFASRHSQSHLSTIGLTNLIAKDFDDYAHLAIELAGDRDRLADLRKGLRAMMAKSPSCDGPRFARNFEAVMRKIWRAWCAALEGEHKA